MSLLLDALLLSCAERLGQAPDACIWRPLQPKPRFHAMPCFPVWSSLLPFAALMAVRFPHVLQQVLREHRHMKRRNCRVNCDFALITGIWRLVEELDRVDKEKQKAVTGVMVSLLSFASDMLLLCWRDDKQLLDARLDDQLLEKFFARMQEFSFKSCRAQDVLKQTVFCALQEQLTLASRAKTRAVPQRVVIYTTTGCMFVPNLAVEVVSMIIKQINYAGLLNVLEVFGLLVASYKAVAPNAANAEQPKQLQRMLVFYIVYVALLRRESVDVLRREVSSDAAAVMELLTLFQMQLCSEILYEDFHVAAPVHWTARVWKHWVFLSEKEVQAFVSEALESDSGAEQEFKKRVATWQAWEALVAFRPSSFSVYTQMKTLVKPHLILSTLHTQLTDEDEFVTPARKRRQTEQLSMISVNPEQLKRSFDVLLLPEVLERVCSFLSAKRLCRMALVCRDFATISHRDSVWHELYLRIGCSVVKKQSVLPTSTVKCHHGDSYKHNWRQMYHKRWTVLQNLRRMQWRAIVARRHSSETSSFDSTNVTFIPRICTYCSCDKVLKSAREQAVHEARHKRFTCTEDACQASFTSLHKLKQHAKEHAQSIAACRLVCGYNDCKKSYSSAKRLATHREKLHHSTEAHTESV